MAAPPDPAQIDALAALLAQFYRGQRSRRPPRHLYALHLERESAMLGHAGLGGRLADALIAAGFPAPSPDLLIAYVQFRMVTQARLALDHLRDRPPSRRQDWPRKAQRYLDAAATLGQRGGNPWPDGPPDPFTSPMTQP